jgi:hypothetical protein
LIYGGSHKHEGADEDRVRRAHRRGHRDRDHTILNTSLPDDTPGYSTLPANTRKVLRGQALKMLARRALKKTTQHLTRESDSPPLTPGA